MTSTINETNTEAPVSPQTRMIRVAATNRDFDGLAQEYRDLLVTYRAPAYDTEDRLAFEIPQPVFDNAGPAEQMWLRSRFVSVVPAPEATIDIFPAPTLDEATSVPVTPTFYRFQIPRSTFESLGDSDWEWQHRLNRFRNQNIRRMGRYTFDIPDGDYALISEERQDWLAAYEIDIDGVAPRPLSPEAASKREQRKIAAFKRAFLIEVRNGIQQGHLNAAYVNPKLVAMGIDPLPEQPTGYLYARVVVPQYVTWEFNTQRTDADGVAQTIRDNMNTNLQYHRVEYGRRGDFARGMTIDDFSEDTVEVSTTGRMDRPDDWESLTAYRARLAEQAAARAAELGAQAPAEPLSLEQLRDMGWRFIVEGYFLDSKYCSGGAGEALSRLGLKPLPEVTVERVEVPMVATARVKLQWWDEQSRQDALTRIAGPDNNGVLPRDGWDGFRNATYDTANATPVPAGR